MKKSEIFKRAIRIELSDIIGKKFNPKKDDLDILPVRYPHRQLAEQITFTSGFLLCLGINVLLIAFVVFRFTKSLPVLCVAAALGVALAFVGACLIATIYLYGAASAIIREQEKEAAKDLPPTERERSDAAFAERMRKKELEREAEQNSAAEEKSEPSEQPE